MDCPFFGTQWNLPSRTSRYPAAREAPVHRQMTAPSPKVVSIPVHFVGSERSRAASAVKIQKVFRGFLVRKNMKRIVAVKREVDEVERRISREEVVDLIRRDSKERLKVSETLMSLLFRLDSVRGVESGVRDCRKAVIRRAIALQEKIDAIAAYEQTIASGLHTETSDPDAEVIDGSRSEEVDGIQESSVHCGETLEIEDSICDYSANEALKAVPNPSIVSDDCICSENNVDGALQLQNPVEPLLDSGDSQLMSGSSLDCFADSTDEIKEEMDVTEIRVGSEITANKDDSAPKETVEDRGDCDGVSKSALECSEDSVDVINNNIDVANVDEIEERMDVTEFGADSEINSYEEASAPEEMVEYPNSAPPKNARKRGAKEWRTSGEDDRGE